MDQNDMGSVVLLVVLAVAVLVALIPLFLTRRAMEGVPEAQRPMNPNMIWLLLIPFFNFYWGFQVYPPMIKGYQDALAKAGIAHGEDAVPMAKWLSISYCLCLVPFVNVLAGPVTLVLFILVLVKASAYRGALERKAGRA